MELIDLLENCEILKKQTRQFEILQVELSQGKPGIKDVLSSIGKNYFIYAHHEPICFEFDHAIKSTFYARQQYAILCRLFQWKAIDKNALLYGLDQVLDTCEMIDHL